MFYSNFGLYGATYNNIISAQVIHVDYNLDSQNLYSDITYSDWSSLNAAFVNITTAEINETDGNTKNSSNDKDGEDENEDEDEGKDKPNKSKGKGKDK